MQPFLKRLWEDLILQPGVGAPGGRPSNVQTSAGDPPAQARTPTPSPLGLPNTYQPSTLDERFDQPDIFDPALKQFSPAFRRGGPVFRDDNLARQWHAIRRDMIDHVLQLVSESTRRDNLILRGSVLLRGWLDENAREPGDVDWVVIPSDIRLGDPDCKLLLSDLNEALRQNPQAATRAGRVEIATDKIATDDIWTYERAPGKRIVVPWRAKFLPPGSVQIDLVFGEELWCEPVLTEVPTFPVGNVKLWTASQELSLAWKLRWLDSDMYPQGKDLYDATLLAERVYLPYTLLLRALTSEDPQEQNPMTPQFPLRWRIDWKNFQTEYPGVQGEAIEWQERLAKALAPTFDKQLE